MAKTQEILIFADSEELAEEIRRKSKDQVKEATVTPSLHKLNEHLDEGETGIVVLGLQRPREEGISLVKKITSTYPEPDILAVTEHEVSYTFSELIKAGASDFIVLPIELDELEAKIARIARERSLREELRRLSIEDSLTGLYNRRMLDANLHKEVHRAHRQGYDLFLVFLDVDRFKTFNDLYGHLTGDELLISLADVLRKNIREHVDAAYRFGGDEFAVSISHTTEAQAFMVAERFRRGFNSLDLQPTSLSLGIAESRPHPEGYIKAAEDLLRRADRALFQAKAKGGNRTVQARDSYDDPTMKEYTGGLLVES